jgi:hypothetical protein
MHGCQKTSQNADDIESLAKRIKTLAETFEKATERGVPLSKAMLERIARLSKYVVITAQALKYQSLILRNFRTWIEGAKEVQEIGSQNYMKRFVNHDNDARAIAGQIMTITWSIHTFTVSSTLLMEFIVDS